uniref:Tartrate-resistant acid phosphatase type 5 n=1 Tax=Plectus sambesii TaxID=2011161 RepID=A0A914WZP6_9BILA
MKLFVALLVCIFAILRIDANQCTDSVCVVDDQSLRFFAIGDFGGEPIWPWYSPVQNDIAKAMEKLGTERNTHFQIELGDNFYTTGVTDVNDKRWKDTFEDIYVGDAMQRPWYVIAGNHDHVGKVEAEVEYTKMSNRWVFPDVNYTIKYQIGQGAQAKLVQFVMFDAILLTGSMPPDYSWWDKAMKLIGRKKRYDPSDKDQSESMWTWIEQQLQQSTADYLFVMGHYPIYSIAEHGPNQILVDRMIPLLHKYHVTMYMSGHDHSLQHFQLTENDSQGKPYMVDYVVNGAGSRGDHSVIHESDVPAGALKWHYPTGWDGGIGGLGFTDGGFTYFEINAQQGQLQFLNKDGDEKHSITFSPRK